MGYIRPALLTFLRLATPVTFTGAIGRAVSFPLRLIIAACVRLRIHPNVLTFTGVLINIARRLGAGRSAIS